MLLRGRVQQALQAAKTPQNSGYQLVAAPPLSQVTPQGRVISVPYDGVPLTIEDMRRMVKDALSREGTPAMRKLVEEIVGQVTPKDYTSEVAAIYYWCLVNVKYLRDPVHVEYVTSPLMVLQPRASDRAGGRRAKQEDCETVASTIAAMCMSIGVPCEFVTISMNRDSGFHHVFCVAKVKGVKLVLDPVPGPEVQEMLRRTVKHQVWPIEPVRYEGQAGWDVASGPSFEGVGRPF